VQRAAGLGRHVTACCACAAADGRCHDCLVRLMRAGLASQQSICYVCLYLLSTYSRSPKNPLLQQFPKCSKSASAGS